MFLKSCFQKEKEQKEQNNNDVKTSIHKYFVNWIFKFLCHTNTPYTSFNFCCQAFILVLNFLTENLRFHETKTPRNNKVKYFKVLQNQNFV